MLDFGSPNTPSLQEVIENSSKSTRRFWDSDIKNEFISTIIVQT